MSDYHPYIRLMTDIIDSGIWANLSSAGKTLYPVLLKFSDSRFKPVWPGTETLMKLTGFKTKKSIVQAKKELTKVGLLSHVPGSGKRATRYYFSFDYEGSKITPLGDTNITLSGVNSSSPGGDEKFGEGGALVTPNHINITISNSNQLEAAPKILKKEDSGESKGLEDLVRLFGAEIAFEAYSQASNIQMEKDYAYLLGIAKEKVLAQKNQVLKSEQKLDSGLPHPASWMGFLDWAGQQLSQTTWKELEKIQIRIDGKVLLIQSPTTSFAKQIIQKYFTEKVKPTLVVLFQEKEEESRLVEIR